ncbi:polyprenyl synthetase family protein [Patescibacteria group bacterium]
MNIKQILFENKKIFDKYLLDFFSNKKDLYQNKSPEMLDMIEKIESQVLRSGKRVRPFLAKQSYLLGGGENDDLINTLGVSLELLHQYFMIHDDIVDRDEKRYGQDSLHIVYEKESGDDHFGKSMAMIAGDLLFSFSNDALLHLAIDEKTKTELMSLIQRAVEDTTLGWQAHFFQNKKRVDEVTEKEFLLGMEYVSARYTFLYPLLMGLELAGNKNLTEKLSNYSINVGMAYQIQDDVLGVFGSTEKTGKPSGNDIREGKKSLLILRAYKNGDNDQKMCISKYLGTNIDQKQLAEMRDIITQTGSLKYSTNLAKKYIQNAKLSLEEIDDRNSLSKNFLFELSDFTLKRSG